MIPAEQHHSLFGSRFVFPFGAGFMRSAFIVPDVPENRPQAGNPRKSDRRDL